MNLKIPLRLGRILVVLALIVALLGSSIPVPARAVGAGLLYNIAANTGVNLALRAIGVGPGNSPEVFNNLVTTIGEAVSSATAPLAHLLITGSSGNFRSFLSADFLSWILSWLFDSGTLNKPTTSYSVSGFMTAGTSTISAPDPFSVYYFYNTERYTYYSIILSATSQTYTVTRDSGFVQTYNGYYAYNGIYYYISNNASNAFPDFPRLPDISVNSSSNSDMARAVISANFPDGYTGAPFTDSDLTLDSVGDSLDSAPYTDWVANSVTHDSESFAPVSVPSLDPADISAQAQGSAQAGNISDAVVDEIIAGAEVDPDVVTLSDIFTAIRSLGTDVVAAVQAVPAAIAAIFEPPVVYDSEGNVLPAYQISLTDFFPFCLPFDIYDLLSALVADPVAPVFEWTIAVPRWGISHDIEIDLSEWDSIARLFRTFELAAFVLGLALITREKFLRS